MHFDCFLDLDIYESSPTNTLGEKSSFWFNQVDSRETLLLTNFKLFESSNKLMYPSTASPLQDNMIDRPKLIAVGHTTGQSPECEGMWIFRNLTGV